MHFGESGATIKGCRLTVRNGMNANHGWVTVPWAVGEKACFSIITPCIPNGRVTSVKHNGKTAVFLM